jgi:GLPGLI family protein
MKRIVVLLSTITLFALDTAHGQQQEGVITYEIRINNHRQLPPGQEGRKAMIPEFRTIKEQLFFNAAASLCKPLIEDDDNDDANNGRRPRFRMRNETYCDQGSGKITLVQQDLIGKTYLIADSVKVAPWKFGTDVKTVQGYDCHQAYYTAEDERKQTITAWYSDKLRPSLGPDRFNTLPGAVLAVDINNGERVFVATKIELRPLKKDELNEPTDGQKTTQAEYRKIMQEEMKNRPGRGRFNRN